MEQVVWTEVMQHKDELIALRRHFHEYPELSGEETKTMNYIEEKLKSWGISFHRVPHGGIIAWIEGNGPGKTLLLRTDLDALPIDEPETNLSQPRVCRSKVPGVMHACGHDGHMAMLLMAARILNDRKKRWPGTAVFMFEEAEEQSGYVEYLLTYLEKESPFHIDACYASHVRWDIPAGKLSVCHESPMAGGFGFEITIQGHGGHGSRPDLAPRPIDCFHDFYSNLQALRMRTVPPREGLTVSIGSIHSGSVLNVIPDELTFAGSSRFFSYDKAGKPFYQEFLNLLASSCETYGCSYDIKHMPKPLFEVHNDPTCVQLAEDAITKCMGADTLTTCEPWMASETFSIATRLYPGVLVFTGVENKEKGCGANHHTPQFDLDEDGLLYGAAACTAFALDFFYTQPDIPFKRPDEPFEELILHNI